MEDGYHKQMKFQICCVEKRSENCRVNLGAVSVNFAKIRWCVCMAHHHLSSFVPCVCTRVRQWCTASAG